MTAPAAPTFEQHLRLRALELAVEHRQQLDVIAEAERYMAFLLNRPAGEQPR